MSICARTGCHKLTRRIWCGRHWAMLSDELRNRFRRTSTKNRDGLASLIRKSEEYLDSLMIGPYEVVPCRGDDCPQRLVWMQGTSGERIPVHAESVQPDDERFDPRRHRSHRGVCPNQQQFRKRLWPGR